MGADRPRPIPARRDRTRATHLRCEPHRGVRFLYPGLEHAVIGETESGKSWFSFGCVAATLEEGGRVVYVHFEESNPADTIKRLLLLGVRPERILAGLDLRGPAQPITPAALAEMLEVPPQLAVLDGQNEGMSLHAQKIMDPDGASAYRQRLAKLFTS